jgi:hypothetical protein
MVTTRDDHRLLPGDHLAISKVAYTHHGIYLGDGWVAEFGGDKCNKPDAAFREVDLSAFDPAGRARVLTHERPPRLAKWMFTSLPRQERVARARFLLETTATGRYNLFGHNCEHAATWCATGFPESHQIRVALYLNMLFGFATSLLATDAHRRTGRIPRWIMVTTAVRFSAVSAYHWHQRRFVREIDRAWRARQRAWRL